MLLATGWNVLNKTCAPSFPLYSTPAMNNASPTLPAPEYFTDENGIRWLNVEPAVCQCASCKVERELGLSLRTPKQCEA